MCGYRVVIPASVRDDFFRELHAAHSGTIKIKAMARSHFWWPDLDQQHIEAIANKCHQFIQARLSPAKSFPSPGLAANRVYQRIHIDFCGPVAGKTSFVVLDSLSKWLEVFPMTTIASTAAIEKLREYFACSGLPETIATYKPQSNGAAENVVKTLKPTCKRRLLTRRIKSTVWKRQWTDSCSIGAAQFTQQHSRLHTNWCSGAKWSHIPI